MNAPSVWMRCCNRCRGLLATIEPGRALRFLALHAIAVAQLTYEAHWATVRVLVLVLVILFCTLGVPEAYEIESCLAGKMGDCLALLALWSNPLSLPIEATPGIN